jgi:nucleoside-diphosphate-sugar epimerase
MKIFITGATGFIGRHLADALAAAGHILYLLVREPTKTGDLNNRDNISLIEGDLERPDSYRQVFGAEVDLVYHLAALSGQKWGADEREYYHTNVSGTANLLKACQEKTRRFIFCSSINAVSTNDFRREPYGKSKWQAEQLVEAAGHSGLETIILRPAVVYGPGAVDGMMLKLCQLISQGKFFRIGSGKNIIPLVYIDDLTEVFLKAAEAGAIGGIYEIIGPDLPTLEEMVNLIAQQLGVKANKFGVPVPVARMAALLSECLSAAWHREPLITRHRVDVILSHRPDFNSQKAKLELGYEPRVDFAQGIAATIDWYRQHGYL